MKGTSRGRSRTPSRSGRQTSTRKDETGSEKKWEVTSGWFGSIVGPLLLMIPCPILCMAVTFIGHKGGGQLTEPTISAFLAFVAEKGGWSDAILECIKYCGFGNKEAWGFLFLFNLLALLIYWWPGKTEYGPITADGHTPQYMDNGVAHCILFCGIFFGASKQGQELLGFKGDWYNMTIIWDTFPGTVGALNTFGLLFCLLLYFKGLNFPTKTSKGEVGDCGTSGQGPLFDYYWGTELYPRFWNVDVKKFVNDRFSMTYWMLAGVSFCYASVRENKGALDPGIFFCALSQFIYLCKFFWWEMGYMRSIDIIADRAGFYETWGCLVWVPSIYTLHTRLMVLQPSGLSWTSAGLIFAFGISGVFLNFWADMQRQLFRENWHAGTLKGFTIWGKQPDSVECTYTVPDPITKSIKTRKSVLLASGFWGVARHFQYFFELSAAWSWSLLSGGKSALPFFYAVFLTILLIHRAKRDEEKCLAKYGDGYRLYMAKVPYKIIPGIF